MIYKAVDKWNSSDTLEHYGVKGMKWGVRKAVERTGRVVRRAGGAVKRSASRIAGGLVRAGSAVRRFKNRRAIKSGDAKRILKRTNKMTNEELQSAVTRTQLINQLNSNNQNRGKTIGDKVSDAVQGKVAKIASEALETSVNSILVGENPIVGVKRKATESISSSKASIAENRRKYINSVSSSSSSDKKESAPSPKITLPTTVTTTPVSDLDKYLLNPYVPRHIVRHSDFLAHYGVKGMKWGVRKQYERTLNGLEKQRLKVIDKKLKSIRVSNSRFSSLDRKKQALNDAKNYDKQSRSISRQQTSILKEIKKNGGGTDVIGYEKSAPSYNRNYMLGALLAGPIANVPLAAYYSNTNMYVNKSLNRGGDTPQNIYSQKFKVRNTRGLKYGNRTTGARYYNSSTPINLLREHAHNVTRRRMYKEKW